MQAANRMKPRIQARAQVQETLQPPLADPLVLAALGGARGKPGRIARSAAAGAYREAILAALPAAVPDRGDALVDAIQTIRRRDADRLRATTIAAIRSTLETAPDGNTPDRQ